MRVNFISSNNTEETRTINVWSNNLSMENFLRLF